MQSYAAQALWPGTGAVRSGACRTGEAKHKLFHTAVHDARNRTLPGRCGVANTGGSTGVATAPDAEHDVVRALDRWVTEGTPPEKLIGTRIVSGAADRTRPLWPFPQVARYDGTGDINDAANFFCSNL